jgi:pSer/pThr/pTyr-binding forkhead associated (FHA) protein
VIIPPTPEPAGPAITPSRVALAIPVLCILGAVAAVVLGGGFYLLRSRTGAPRAAAPSEAPQAGATMMASDMVMAAPLATLTVLEGPKGMVDEVLRVYGNTTMGRNPAQVSLAFYADEESSVSRLHAAIDPDPSGDFNLTDRNSSAGTRLNGRQIQAGVPVTLEDGDEIVLGDLARRGVKLRFNLATGESVGPYSGSADDRTHLVGDRGLPDWGDPPLD